MTTALAPVVRTALVEEAVSRGDAVLVGKLVKKGADVNTTNEVQLCLFILRSTAFYSTSHNSFNHKCHAHYHHSFFFVE